MPIPSAFDGQLAEIENAASSVSTALRTMNHANPRDAALMRSLLREKMQHYVEVVFAAADEIAERERP